jgi:hypothetical protein
MKYAIFLLFLLLSADVFGQINGTLLKANGKPLQYTEIELVPVDSKRMVMNQNLFSTSGTSGKFSFQNVPRGVYTLSINFDDKPTDLSPYGTFFYPNAENRMQAERFEITESSQPYTVVFKLPPPLVKRKITGNALFTNGSPVVGAYIGLRDVLFDRHVDFNIARTDAKGNFTVSGFTGREYQLGALLFDAKRKTIYNPWGEIIAAGESKIFTLVPETPVIKFTVRQSEDIEKIRDKYVAVQVDFEINKIINAFVP